MNSNETIRSTFAEDTKMTPGIVRVIADIAKNSLTSFHQKKEISDQYYRIFRNKKPQPQQVHQVKKSNIKV